MVLYARPQSVRKWFGAGPSSIPFMSITIAIEGGGTRTRAGAYTDDGTCMAEAEGPGSNPCAYGVERSAAVILEVIERLRASAPGPVRIVVAGVAGTGPGTMRQALATTVAAAVQAPVLLTGDLQPILAANAGEEAAVLVVAGTGSCVYARRHDGAMRGLGGRGAVFSDEGSAYALATAGLRAASASVDRVAPSTVLLEALCEAAGVPTFSEMPAWAERHSKDAIASLAPAVIAAAEAGDAPAHAVIELESGRLAMLVAEAVTWSAQGDAPVMLLQHGGLFEHAPIYKHAFESHLAKLAPQAHLTPLALSGPRAVAEIALRPSLSAQLGNEVLRVDDFSGPAPLPPTERPGDTALPLDALDALGIVKTMLDAEAEAVRALDVVAETLAALVTRAAKAIREGGRIVYCGAGTSGRLGVLDASECAATFGVSPNRVVGIIAGGEAALRTSIEGAEDDTEAAVEYLDALSPPLSALDVVVGIAASGTTPFVHAALAHAHAQGAATAMVSCNARASSKADFHIALDTGPEVLPGSTRLKAGTATKRALNIITTGAMTLSGFVFEGRMVGVRPTNVKLRARSVRIVRELLAIDENEAETLLDAAGGDIRVAVVMHRRGVDADAARGQLEQTRGNLREALGK
mgnify:CR=1 FL=1